MAALTDFADWEAPAAAAAAAAGDGGGDVDADEPHLEQSHGSALLGLDSEMTGLLSAAEAPVDESDHKHGKEGQPPHLTADGDDTLADVAATATAVAGAAHSDANVAVSSPSVEQPADVQSPLQLLSQSKAETEAGSGTHEGRVAEGFMLSLDAEMAGLVPVEDSEPAVHAMLSLDQEMAGLVPDADMTHDGDASHNSPSAGQYDTIPCASSNMLTDSLPVLCGMHHNAALMHAQRSCCNSKPCSI